MISDTPQLDKALLDAQAEAGTTAWEIDDIDRQEKEPWSSDAPPTAGQMLAAALTESLKSRLRDLLLLPQARYADEVIAFSRLVLVNHGLLFERTETALPDTTTLHNVYRLAHASSREYVQYAQTWPVRDTKTPTGLGTMQHIADEKDKRRAPKQDNKKPPAAQPKDEIEALISKSEVTINKAVRDGKRAALKAAIEKAGPEGACEAIADLNIGGVVNGNSCRKQIEADPDAFILCLDDTERDTLLAALAGGKA